jgi:hypothetical protein
MIAPLDGDAFQLFPTASIDPFGDIVVAWYDNRRGLTNRTGRFLLDFFATYSTDGGSTWATPFQVNEVANPFDPDPGVPISFDHVDRRVLRHRARGRDGVSSLERQYLLRRSRAHQ